MSEPITTAITFTDPPTWWPALLTALTTADAEVLHQRHASSYTRAPFPGEWWPAQPGTNTRVHVTLDDRTGIIQRRLVLAS